MIIFIEGKSGKSRVLENYINEETEGKVLVLDGVGVFGMQLRDDTTHLYIKDLSVSMLNHIDVQEQFGDYKWIVLEVNVSATDKTLDSIMKLESESEHDWIVTIQNYEMEEVEVYQFR